MVNVKYYENVYAGVIFTLELQVVKFSGKAEFEGLFVTWSQDRLSRLLSF